MTEKPVTLDEIMQMVYAYGNEREMREMPNSRRESIRRALEPVFARAELAESAFVVLSAIEDPNDKTDAGRWLARYDDATKGASG